MEEPSVLDYVKSKLMFWRGERVAIPEPEAPPVEATPGADLLPAALLESEPEPAVEPQPAQPAAQAQPGGSYRVPWLALLALLCALMGQSMFEPPRTFWTVGVALYALAAILVVLSARAFEGFVPALPPEREGVFATNIRSMPFFISLGLIIAGYLAFGGNRFTPLNVFIWFLLILATLLALWNPQEERRGGFARLRAGWQSGRWKLNLTRWGLLVLLASLVILFYRLYRLSGVPGEMISDHAEKLLDVNDLLGGQIKIFFERNTGREFFQFYLTAAIIRLFHTGISFLSLKLGTVLAGLFTLPFVYKLGKEIGGRWVGLAALFLTGVSYWANVNARFGLRFPFYPMFTAPALYFLISGLRARSRNRMILSGLALGIGLHGYSPMRIVPFVIVAAVLIYFIHGQSRGNRRQAIFALLVLAFVSFVIFLPLFRYATLDNPEMFGYRAISRLSGTERALPGSPLLIFLQNAWSAVTMPFWDNNNIWVHSVTNRPALDIVSAALFFLGLVILVIRYLQKRNWLDLFLLSAFPLLMLPSILSLAFPEENPSLNRTGGAYIPVFLIAAIGLEAIIRVVRQRMGPKWGARTAVVFAGFLMLWSASQNYDLVFRQYDSQFMAGAWNTSQIGGVIRGFAESVGTPDTAYVAGFPYWVDTRLVGINAGFPTHDYAIWAQPPENTGAPSFRDTLAEPRSKLFIIKSDDSDSLAQLLQIYPQAILSQYNSGREGKDFVIALVPGQPSAGPVQPTPLPEAQP